MNTDSELIDVYTTNAQDLVGASAATSLATGLTVGSPIVTVYDANMCFVTISDAIGQPVSNLEVTTVTVAAENCGKADGAITVTGNAVVSPVTVTIVISLIDV